MKKSGTILIILATVVLGGIALFTAIRLYQQGTQPVAPNVPGSTPSAADVTEACSAITFSISSPTPTPTVAPSATPAASVTPTPSFPPVTTATPSPSPTPIPTPTQPPTGGIATPTPTPTPIVIVTPVPSFPPVAQATPLTTAPPIPVTGGELPTLAAIFGAIIFIVVALRFAL